jgi:hypothetical protein
MKSILIKTASMIALVGSAALAQQPKPSKAVENFNCQDGPKMNGTVPDTIATRLDSGFVSLFNGKDLTGWWENCTPHSSNKVKGGVWWPDADQGLLFSREEGQDGDILVTNQTYDNYEFIMDLWPTFGNDGGIFNRVVKSGKNWQTTIDYISGSGVAGSFNEGGWAPGVDINHDPFRFGGAGPENPTLPTADATWVMWTDFTKTQNPTSFGCSANGCTSADFVKIWDVAGWNQIRVKFYDGLEPGRSVNMETFIRKLGAPNWVPVYKSKRAVVTAKGPVALQIHGGGRWNAGSYNVYRNIKIRPLTVDGSPILPTSVLRAPTGKLMAPNLNIVGGMLTGMLDGEYDVTLTDVRGQVVEKFHAAPGLLQHSLAKGSQGVLIANFKNSRGSAHIRLSRI